VSRTPLREAIKLLAAEGLVDLLPNRGAVAVKLTEADVLNTFEVLAMLEGMSGELAASASPTKNWPSCARCTTK
jgi:DNA-binding GntR family transcriptional regulator